MPIQRGPLSGCCTRKKYKRTCNEGRDTCFMHGFTYKIISCLNGTAPCWGGFFTWATLFRDNYSLHYSGNFPQQGCYPWSQNPLLRLIKSVANEPNLKISGAQVVVTGAGGKTGGLVLEKLLSRPNDFVAKAIVRNEQVCLT
jgi:hypothetical protein